MRLLFAIGGALAQQVLGSQRYCYLNKTQVSSTQSSPEHPSSHTGPLEPITSSRFHGKEYDAPSRLTKHDGSLAREFKPAILAPPRNIPYVIFTII